MIDHLIKVHKELTEEEIKEIWRNGVFIFDSNVLLDLYRLPSEAKDDLISVLQNKNFNSRIWIGFQVALEFLNNRLNIIGEQKNMYSRVIKLTEDHICKINELNEIYAKEINKLNLIQRHSTIDPRAYINKGTISKSVKKFKEFQKYLKDSETEHLDVNNVDSIKDIIFEIFKDKIGEPFEKVELEKINKEGEERYKNSFPPGYMDMKKEGQHAYKELSFVRKFGDLYLWNEIMNYANKSKSKYIVLVTGDVKEDWWEEKRGRKLGPRKELLNEIYNKCKSLNRFHIYNTSTFLKFAKQELDNNIKETSIEDTQNLINENLRRTKRYFFSDQIKSEIILIDNKIHELKILLHDNIERNERISKHKDNLYNSSEPSDDIRDHVHDLGYLEEELQQEKDKLLNHLKSLEMNKMRLLDKYKYYLEKNSDK